MQKIKGKHFKLILFVVVFIILMCILACQASKVESFPDIRKMETNLGRKKYSISTIQTLESLGGGTYLLGRKNEDYIEFYWLKEHSAVSKVKDLMEVKHASEVTVVTSDPKDASISIVYCGSEKALMDAGVRKGSSN